MCRAFSGTPAGFTMSGGFMSRFLAVSKFAARNGDLRIVLAKRFSFIAGAPGRPTLLRRNGEEARIARERTLVGAPARHASAAAGYGEISWN
jgi:hypothetical protein